MTSDEYAFAVGKIANAVTNEDRRRKFVTLTKDEWIYKAAKHWSGLTDDLIENKFKEIKSEMVLNWIKKISHDLNS